VADGTRGCEDTLKGEPPATVGFKEKVEGEGEDAEKSGGSRLTWNRGLGPQPVVMPRANSSGKPLGQNELGPKSCQRTRRMRNAEKLTAARLDARGGPSIKKGSPRAGQVRLKTSWVPRKREPGLIHPVRGTKRKRWPRKESICHCEIRLRHE